MVKLSNPKKDSLMKNKIAFALVGMLLGVVFSWTFFSVKVGEEERQANNLIDFVVGQWTRTSEDETIGNDYELSQLPSKGKTVFRLGYIPDTIRTLASIIEKKYNVPHAVTLAQWILESGWGKNGLGANNVFGHTFNATKRFLPAPKFVLRRELINVVGLNIPGKTVKFTSYRSIEECFDVHGRYLSHTQFYRAAFFANNPEQFARIISLYYATDPDYSTKLITIIRRYRL